MYQEDLYYKCVKTPYGVLSVDNIRIAFEVHPRYLPMIAQFFNDYSRIDIEKYPESFKMGSYRHMWTVRYSADASMSVGLDNNGSNAMEDARKGYLDFNPNKVGFFDRFWRDYDTLKQWCVFEVKRCDIAYDVPIERSLVRLYKDKRKYKIDCQSVSDFTEYLGQRNKTGYIKVYNKQVESKLDVPLTRIELTCGFDAMEYMRFFPPVYVIQNGKQISLDVAKLNENEKTILSLAMQVLGLGGNPFQAFKQIQRPEKRKKLIELMPVEPLPLPDSVCVLDLLSHMKEVLRI